MKTKLRLHLWFLALLNLSGFAHGQGTAFTYQGRLTDNGTSANGAVELRCILWNALSGGTQVAMATPATTVVTVTNGLFTMPLDFGTAAFDGSDRYLQIEARTTTGTFSLLTPRQRITGTPYALLAGKLSGTVASSGLGGTYGSAVTFSNAANVFNGTFTGNGSGLSNVNAASLGGLSISNFWKLGGNAGTTLGANFVGTVDNQPLEFKVNGNRALRLEPTTANGAVNVIAGFSQNSVAAGIAGATIGGGGGSYLGDIRSNGVAAAYGTVSGGAGNLSLGEFATVGGGIGNVAIGEHATVGGGVANRASDAGFGDGGSTVGGGGENTASSRYSTVGGGDRNTAGAWHATVAGGVSNTAIRTSATVAGGEKNTASGPNATVGGGILNTSSGDAATVGGGQENTAASDSDTVGGGENNHASGSRSTVGGGAGNRSEGIYATVPGGAFNSASGRDSFAAGYNAKANHDGSFVWANRFRPAPSFAASRFHINAYNGLSVDYSDPRADGGGTRWIVIGATSGGQAIATSTGAWLSDGGVWNNNSDRNRKDGFAAVHPREVLDKLAALPIQTWHYTNETAEIRHLGPMAQDFRAAFGLGSGDKSIATVDAEGVALAAIQGLNQKVEEQGHRQTLRSRKLEAENAELKQKNVELESRLGTLEKLINRLSVAKEASDESSIPSAVARLLREKKRLCEPFCRVLAHDG